MLQFIGSILGFLFAPVIEAMDKGVVCQYRACATSGWGFLLALVELVVAFVFCLFFGLLWRDVWGVDEKTNPFVESQTPEQLMTVGVILLVYLLLPNLFFGYNGH